MSRMHVLANFHQFIETPRSISRLRRFILDAAVRGKLVAQDERPSSVVGLLDLISAGWAELSKSESVQKLVFANHTHDESIPFSVPKHWAFVRLGEVLQMNNGRAFTPSDWKTEGIPIVRIQNLNNINAEFNYCDPNVLHPRHRIENGDLLISWSGTPGTSFGSYIWERGPAALNQHIFRCVQVGSAYNLFFLSLAINSQLDLLISKAQGGLGLRHVTKSTLESLLLPLPPLSEQESIVAKVNELTKICDDFGKLQDSREKLRDKFLESSLNRLQLGNYGFGKTAKNVKTSEALLSKIFENLQRVGHIQTLKLKVLDIALLGRVSKAQDLQKQLPFTKIRDLADIQSGYAFKSEWFSNQGHRLLRNTNIGHGEINWNEIAFLPNAQVPEFERFLLRENDIVLSLNRPFINTGTKASVIRASDLPCLLVQRICRLRLDTARVSPEYVVLWMQSTQFNRQFDLASSSGVPYIAPKQVENASIFLPSLREQIRIVSSVKKLFDICERLEEALALVEFRRDEVMTNVLDKLIGIRRSYPKAEATTLELPTKDAETSNDLGAKMMNSNKIINDLQLLDCLSTLGGISAPEDLMMQSGIGEEEVFYDLVRQLRDSGKIKIKLGYEEKIEKVINAN